MLSLSSLIAEVNSYYQNLLNIQPNRTKLQILSQMEWEKFCKDFNFSPLSKGIFLVRNLTCYLSDSEFLRLNLFHEYFGHGLFFEYSKYGKFIYKLEKKLEKEERKFLKGKEWTLEQLSDFRKENPFFKLINKQENNLVYEIFAIWTEYHLSKLFGFKYKFKQKYKKMSNEMKEGLEKFIDFQNEFGELALYYEMGMPKYYSLTKIKELLKTIFKKKIDSARLVILYGSRKPYSDIDIFMVSDEIKSFRNEWLDIYAMDQKEFEYSVSVFRISVTDPLLTGDLILGDEYYFEQKKKQIQEQPITQEAIYYNLSKSEEQKNLAKHFPKNSKEYAIATSYAQTYFKNAFFLKQGKRKLTKSCLLS